MAQKKCTLVNPETGKSCQADILSKDKLKITVRPTGSTQEISLFRGDTTIPYRGSLYGQYFTVHLD